MQLIQVGRSKIEIKNKLAICKYSNVPKDDNGWVHDLTYRPIPFDMMLVKILDFPKLKTAWWNGRKWIGLRIRPQDQIIAWKRNPDHD